MNKAECSTEEYIRRLEWEHGNLLEAAQEALALLQKGAPGWGVAKDILRSAIHMANGGK